LVGDTPANWLGHDFCAWFTELSKELRQRITDNVSTVDTDRLYAAAALGQSMLSAYINNAGRIAANATFWHNVPTGNKSVKLLSLMPLA